MKESRNLEQDRESWNQLLEQLWVLRQGVEPRGPSGESTLLDWLDSAETGKGKMWTCAVPLDPPQTRCEHAAFNRIHRAIAHIRVHLGVRPYPCGGKCGMASWYVPAVIQDFTIGATNIFLLVSELRFHSAENRGAHCRGPTYRTCEYW